MRKSDFWIILIVAFSILCWGATSVSLITERHQNILLQRKLTATVEACGEAWLNTPIATKDLSKLNQGDSK